MFGKSSKKNGDEPPPSGPVRLTESAKAQIEPLLEPGEEIRVAVEADMVLPGSFGTSWLIGTDRRLASFVPNGGDEASLVEEVRLQDAVALKCRNLQGSLQIDVHTKGRAVPLLRATDACRDAVSETFKELQALLPDSPPEEEDEHNQAAPRRTEACPKCAKPMLKWMTTCPECADKRELLGRLLQRSKPYTRPIVFSLALALLLRGLRLTLPLMIPLLVDHVLPNRDVRGLMYVVGIILGITLISAIVGPYRRYLMAWLAQRIIYDMRGEMYTHVQKLGLSYYDRRDAGWIMDRIGNDTGNLQTFMTSVLPTSLLNVVTLIWIAFFMFTREPILALLALLPTPLVIAMNTSFWKRTHRVWHRVWRRRSRIFSLLGSVLPGVRVVKAFVQEEREHDRFDYRNQQYRDAHLEAASLFTGFSRKTGLLMGLSTIIIWGYGGWLVIQNPSNVPGGTPTGVTAGVLVMFMSYVAQFYGPLAALLGITQQVQSAATSAQRVFEVLDTAPDMTDGPEAQPVEHVEGRIEFKNVSFSYDDQAPVIKHLSFVIEPGEMIGLVGASGSGKTTIISLLNRFYDPSEGQILLDGRDLRDLQLQSMRSHLGVVLQEPFLFHGTVAENIAYGMPEAEMVDIIKAAKAANAHDFVLGLPDGYEAMVGERGARLSGGERQRISIARAILKNPAILILDEATSSVDTQTEYQIREAIERMVQGRTTIAIAHRLSTLRSATRLFVMDKGKLVEQGTHAELMAKEDGIFRKLADIQREIAANKAPV